MEKEGSTQAIHTGSIVSTYIDIKHQNVRMKILQKNVYSIGI